MDKLQVSHSKLRTWKMCRFAYHYKYKEKLRRKVKGRPLQFGSLMHEAIEAHHEGQDMEEFFDQLKASHGKLFQEEVEEYGDILTTLRVIFYEYLATYKGKEIKPIRKNKKWSEHWFEYEMDKDILFVGKIDLFGRLPNKQKGLIERKTFSRMPDPEFRWKNTQSQSYVKVSQELGLFDPDVVCWDYIRSKEPSKPQVLKRGGFSTRDCDTLPTALLIAAEEAGIKVKSTDLIYKRAVENRARYFVRTTNAVNQQVVDNVFQELVASAKCLRDECDRPPFRTIDKHCQWCDYRDICRAELTGSDSDFVKERLYQIETKTSHQSELSAETEESNG